MKYTPLEIIYNNVITALFRVIGYHILYPSNLFSRILFVMHLQALTSSVLLLLSLSVAHPGHDPTEEILERRSFKNSVRHASLTHCADKLKARGVQSRNLERRAATVAMARLSQDLTKRDTDSVLAESHNKTSLGYSENTSISDLFSANASCVLTPEVTQGPYCMLCHLKALKLPS